MVSGYIAKLINPVLLAGVLGMQILSAQMPSLRFAPLPTKSVSKNVEEFLPIKNYVSKTLSIAPKFVYKKNYRDILDGFKKGEIDVAYLGPLPFVQLRKEYPYVAPLVTFRQKNGSSGYRCILAKLDGDTIEDNASLTVALTQPLSTCGYLMTHKLLQQTYGRDLADEHYRYTMSHTNALSALARGEFRLAGAKESIARRFKSLGVTIVARTELLPGFLLVANTKTLSPQQIATLKKTLLQVPESVYRHWNHSIGNRGMLPASNTDYDKLDANITIPPLGNMP